MKTILLLATMLATATPKAFTQCGPTGACPTGYYVLARAYDVSCDPHIDRDGNNATVCVPVPE